MPPQNDILQPSFPLDAILQKQEAHNTTRRAPEAMVTCFSPIQKPAKSTSGAIIWSVARCGVLLVCETTPHQ